MQDKRLIKLAAGVFLLSLAIRVTWVVLAHVTPISDFQGYDELALKWLRTGSFSVPGSLAYRTPGYPGFLAAVYAVAGHSWRVAGFAQAVLGALTSGLLVLLAAKVLSRPASTIAGLLHALSPTALAYVPVLASETVAVFLLVSGLLCLAVGSSKTEGSRWPAFAASGALFGLLLLVRPAASFFLPACVLLAIYDWKLRIWRARPVLVFAGAVLLVLLPWLVRNQQAGLGLTLSTVGGENLLMGNNDLARLGGFCEGVIHRSNLPEREQNAVFNQAAKTWIVSHPQRYLALSGIRSYRLFGTESDTWAATYLAPSRENDLAFLARYLHNWEKAQPASPALLKRAGDVEVRNAETLTKIRMAAAPLIFLALLLSLLRWRNYALILLPTLFYLGGLAFTYVEIRFRELADPLLFIPFAALLSDLFLQTTDLRRRPWLQGRAAQAVLGVANELSADLTGGGKRAVQADASRAEEARKDRELEATEFAFHALPLNVVDDHGFSVWSYAAHQVKAVAEGGGLRCDIVTGRFPAAQYGGLAIPAASPKVLRFAISFAAPESIKAVTVECRDQAGRRCAKWHWRVASQDLPQDGPESYVLVPGKQSWFFLPQGASDAAATQEIHFYLQVAPDSQAGFVLHTLEVGE